MIMLNKFKQFILIRLLEARMYQITFETSAEDIDIEEVNAILRLIKIVNSNNDPNYFTPDKALKRFVKYYNWRRFMEAKHGNNISNTTK